MVSVLKYVILYQLRKILLSKEFFVKFLYDYFPVICFFIAYKLYDIYVATAVAIVVSFLQLTCYWLKCRRFEKLHVITFILISILGGFTLIFHQPIFIKWKPSIIYWLFGGTLFVSQFLSASPLLCRMLKDKIQLPNHAWNTLNMSWAIFFITMGFVNLYVVYHYDTNAWVNFKLFGTLLLTLLFMILQAFYIAKYLKQRKKT